MWIAVALLIAAAISGMVALRRRSAPNDMTRYENMKRALAHEAHQED